MRKLSTALLVVILAAAAGFYFFVRQGFSTRTAPGAMESYLATRIRDWSMPAQYKIRNPVTCSDEAVADGLAHWADHCATCHANNGNGETMLGKTMYPRPPDMRREETQRKTDGELYYIIKNGVRLSGMPAFGEAGDADTDSWKLVCFIRHLPQLSSEEEQRMKKLNPKSPDELEEERQEEEFLNGGTPSEHDEHHHQH